MPDESTRPSPTVASRRVYSGRVVSLDIDTVRFPNGRVGELEMIRHPGASTVVPFLDAPGQDNPRVLLIRQYRYAAEDFLYEVPAGRLDPGEAPEACAGRELREETGYSAAELTRLGGFYTTPGFIDEFIHAFAASGLIEGAASLEHDELITVEAFPLATAMSMVQTGRIVDGKTIVSLYLAERFRHQ